MLKKLVMLAIYSILLIGCTSSKSVYVLNKEEVLSVKKGDTVTVQFDGWFFSNRAVSRVIDAKIVDVNLK